MQSTIETHKTYNKNKGRWIHPYNAYQILTANGCFLPDGHFLNPEGVYENDLNGYIKGETSISEIDDSLNWFYNDNVESECFDSETEYLAKDVYVNTKSREQFENMTCIKWNSPELKKFMKNVFFNSSRKGYTAPCVFNGWNICVLPAGGDIKPRTVLEALNNQECNKNVVKVTKFRSIEHQDLSHLLSDTEFESLNEIQKEHIKNTTIIVYYLDKLKNYPIQ